MFKRIIICFAMMCFCCDAFADTINIDWIVDGQQYQTSSCTVGGDLNVPTPPEKYGYNFIGWVSFTPIEYIETTGTQYINTGIIANQDTRVMMTLMITTNTTGLYLLGAANCMQVKNYATDFRYFYSPQTNNYAIVNTGQNVVYKKYTLDGNKNVFTEYDENGAYVNSVALSEQNFTCSVPLYIARGNGIASTPIPMKIYSAKIWDNDELVRNFIPVLDANGIACLYDLVSNEYFYNAGTGDFTPGPELTE